MELKVLFVKDDFEFISCNSNGVIDNDYVSAYSFYTKEENELLAKHPVSKLSDKDTEVLKNSPHESLVAVFKIKPKFEEKEGNVDDIIIHPHNFIPLTGEFEYVDKLPSCININKLDEYDIEFAELVSLKTFSDFCDYMLSKDNGYQNISVFVDSHMIDNLNIRCRVSSTYDEAIKIKTGSDDFRKFMLDFAAFLDKSLESALDYITKSVDDIKALELPKADKLLDNISRLQYGDDGEIADCMFKSEFKINKSDLEETRKLIKKELDKLRLSWEDWSVAQNIYSVLSMVVRMVTMYKSGLLYSQMGGRDVLPEMDDASIPLIRNAYESVRFDLLQFYQRLMMIQKEIDGLNNPEVRIHIDDDTLNVLSKSTLNYLNKHLVSGYKDIDEDDYATADDIPPHNRFRDCDFTLYSFRNIFRHSFKLKFPVTDDMETRLKDNHSYGQIFRDAKVVQENKKRYLEIPAETLCGNYAGALFTLIKEYKMSNGGR